MTDGADAPRVDGVVPPRADGDVVGFWRHLGLPGIIDLHVHFMPQRLLDAVWRYFDSAGPLTGREWPIHYRWPEEQRLDRLRTMGVRAFSSLLYAHKPQMAESLNDWAADFAREHSDVVQTMTLFPEPSVSAYVDKALRGGARIVKVHVQVGGFDPREPVLDDVWAMLSDARVPVVAHVGSGPAPGAFTGPGPFADVLARHPQLTAVVAHMGMPEYDAFLDMAERYDNVHVDTTMCFTDSFGDQADLGRRLAPRLADLAEKVVFGADFPNIPHPYAHQLEVLVRLGLGDDWLRGVVWSNPLRLLERAGSDVIRRD
ncbi:MAG TPA: amidohydrolase family protein [Mycobacteriales bacterium]|nr:amidohydrolase family protein [Mycobacteriales bacterium]